jgi:glycine/D-amino acid oxidase-like deaminating enzyme
MRIGVVGAGIFGIAATLELQARGHSVVVFDQGKVPNPKASSTDVAKTIRRFYGETSTYVELVERAAARWREWNDLLGQSIYHVVGTYYIVPRFEPGTPIFDGYQFLRARGAPIEVLNATQGSARFPQFAYGAGDTGVYDPWGGYLSGDVAVAGLTRLARDQGAEVCEETPVLLVEEDASGVDIVVEGGQLRFERAVVATGAWMSRLAPVIGRHIRVTRQQMVFLEPKDPRRLAIQTLPAWAVDADESGWYGQPLPERGWVKVANDLPGSVVDPDASRAGTAEFAEQALAFVAERIPSLAGARLVSGRSCLYDITPDRHFVIDWRPGSRRVLLAGGGSGHGFKFGAIIGEVIADALEEELNPLGDLFRIASRFDALSTSAR